MSEVSTPFWQLAQVWTVIGLVFGSLLTTIGVLVNSRIVSGTAHRQIKASLEQAAAQIDARREEQELELAHRASQARIDHLIEDRRPYLSGIRENSSRIYVALNELREIFDLGGEPLGTDIPEEPTCLIEKFNALAVESQAFRVQTADKELIRLLEERQQRIRDALQPIEQAKASNDKRSWEEVIARIAAWDVAEILVLYSINQRIEELLSSEM